jgi:hypothetical protein
VLLLSLWEEMGLLGYLRNHRRGNTDDIAIGTNIASAVSGIFGIVILGIVLNIGQENKGWPQLE